MIACTKFFVEVNDVAALKSYTKWQMGQRLILVTPGTNFTQYHTLWLLFYSKRGSVLFLSNILLHKNDAVHYLTWIEALRSIVLNRLTKLFLLKYTRIFFVVDLRSHKCLPWENNIRFNQFQINFLSLCAPENRKPGLFRYFQRYRKEKLVWNGLT